jgi:outer membrane protein OmpA-like peptidoglycan-associated protein
MIDQQGLFKNYFLGRDGFHWWIGQIAPAQTWETNIPGYPVASNEDSAGFAERYKVRIMGYHTAQKDDLPDEDLPWATVMYPVTAGGGPKGSFQSANLTQGTFVFGFFLDGEDAQQPVIMGTIGYNDYNQVMSGIPKTAFIPFTGYETGELISVTNVKSVVGGEKAPLSSTGGKRNITESTTQSVNGSNSTKVQASTEAKDDGQSKEALDSPTRCRTLGGKLQMEIMNTIQEIEKKKKSVYKWQYGLSKKAADLEKEIKEFVAKQTEKVMKWFKDLLTNAEQSVIDFVNKQTKKFHSLLFPNDRPKLRKASETALDVIACLFKKLIANLGKFVLDFLLGASTRIINVANCLVDNFVGGILGQISSILDSIIGQALSAFNSLIGGAASLVNEALSIAGAGLEILLGILSFITCDEEPSCPAYDNWSIWDGPFDFTQTPDDISGLVERITSFAGRVTDTVDETIDLDNFNLNIDIDGLFDLSGCDTGPRTCGSPTLQILGGGEGVGAAINLVVSRGGSVIGADIVNTGVRYLSDAIFGKVYDDCGTGNGAVVELVLGPVTVSEPDSGAYARAIGGTPVTAGATGGTPVTVGGTPITAGGTGGAPVTAGGLPVTAGGLPVTAGGSGGISVTYGGTGGTPLTVDNDSNDSVTVGGIGGTPLVASGTGQLTTDPTGLLEPGTETTGIVAVNIIEGGTGYLPSPDGSTGGDGRVWAENNETTVQHENGDYEIPTPPGNLICVVAGDIVKLPVGTSVVTEPNNGVDGGETILGGNLHIMKKDGCFTAPEIDYESLGGRYPTDDTGAYPVILYLCEILIQNSGINYQPTDRVIIEPSNGAEASVTFDNLGAVTGIKVTKGGEGFTELPEIYIESDTGFNAVLLPRLCIDRIGNNVDKPVTGDLVQVIDCVGKF